MKFWHESTKETIRVLSEHIQGLEKDLRDPVKQRVAGITWDVHNDVLCHDSAEYFWETLEQNELRFYFWKAISVELFEDFFSVLEEAFSMHGYELSEEPAYSYGSDSVYCFVCDDEPRIKVTIASGVCKQVNTGKMVPETKTDCGFLEV